MLLLSSVVHRRIFYFSFLTPLILSSVTHNRRILHQPFVPQDSIPPTPPPNLPSFSPITSATNSSSTTPPEAPFFPFLFSPPPPPFPASSASFPATVILPPASKSKRASSKLIATAVIAAVAAVVLFSIALYLHFRKRKFFGLADTKTQTSNNSSRNHYHVSGRENIPNLQRPLQTSSELFYLGTLVSSHGGVSNEGIDHPQNSPFSDSTSLVSRKQDSPELRPLPPLSGQTARNNHGNAELGVGRHDDEEEFYSPKGSLGAIDSSIETGSASRRAFSAAELETFGGLCSSSSYLSSSSASDSPVRSASRSNSPPVNLSPIKLSPISPELVAINPVPLRPPPPAPPLPPPPVSLFRVSLVDQKESQSPSPSPSPSFSLSKSSSPPTSTSPERVYSKIKDTSPRVSNSTNTKSDSPQLSSSLVPSPLLIPSRPPPPPPPPLPVFENPRILTPEAMKLISKPPDLMAPLRPISVDNPSLISPIQLPPNLKIGGNTDKVLESNSNYDDNEDVSKPKLKPLHWDKVRASSDREMVWDQLKSSSFRLNEEMFETLFVAKASNLTPMEATRWPVLPLPSQVNRILDAKKSQNIAILLKALNVTVDEVCDALVEGNADNLGAELLESLLKMAPSKEEERKLKEHKDDSPIKLGVAEKFLKAMLDIPFAFKRVEALLYVSNFESEIEYLKNSFLTLEAACEELRKNRMFLKLLEAVLKTGNRMNIGTNRGDAQAFKLDTLLKLVDIKGADGKTTLLHFVVQEIIRTEGARLLDVNQNTTSTSVNDDNNDDFKCRKLGLQVVSSLGSELNNVKKAAAMDSEVLHSDFLKLSNGLKDIAEAVKLNQTVGGHVEKTEFSMSMTKFIENSETQIIRIQAQESVALTLVKEITEYFHGNSAKEEARPFRIFMVVRDFLTVLDRVCREIGSINERITVSNAHKFPIPMNPTLQQTSTGFHVKRQYSDSEEDESL